LEQARASGHWSGGRAAIGLPAHMAGLIGRVKRPPKPEAEDQAQD